MNGLPRPRVVVAEPFADSGLAVLRENDLEIVSCVGKPASALIAALAEADGLIVRSETRVDRTLLSAAPKLAVIARAGVGVDAIDVEAATDAGIVVINTPAANTLAAVEQTFTLMLGSVRRLPAANAALRAGIWDRKLFIGTELANKTLGIIGLGRIGGGVAVRAAAFGMKLLAYDPFISAARAEALGAHLIPLEELLKSSDIVTLHVPLTKQTRGMIDASKITLMKPSALLINCARGGVIDEVALLEALDAGTIAAAAIDVVAEEPPPADGTGARLHKHLKVVATPHLGGSTHEALERIAIQLATDLAAVLRGAPAAGAVNAPIADGPDAQRLTPFVDVAYRMGKLYPQLTDTTTLSTIALVMQGQIAELNADPILTSFLTGLLQVISERRVTIVNARAIAEELGIHVDVRSDPQANAYTSSLRVVGGDTSLTGTSIQTVPRVVSIDGFEVDATPIGALLLTQHADVPGMIGKVGTILGEANINISTMQVSRTEIGGMAMMVLATDRPTDTTTVKRLRAIEGISHVRVLDL
jgi:D-3-phosphoglycerate dehydrogenase / 2-oxoglutarate reductase